IVFGAFRTSPAESLQCLANVPPLQLQWQQQTLSYAISVAANRNLPNFTIVYPAHPNPIYEKRPNTPAPISRCVSHNNIKTVSEPPQVYSIAFSPPSPWLYRTPTMDTTLARWNKNDLPQVIINQ